MTTMTSVTSMASMAAVTTMMTHVVWWWHHVGWSIRVGIWHWVWARANSWVRTAEACSTTLEVGETAGWTRPIARTRTILARWERSQNLRSTVEDTARGRRDFNCFVVQCTAIHAKTFSSLYVYMSHWLDYYHWNKVMTTKLTSSWEEKTAKPVPVGLCWSGVLKVQKAIGRPPN